MAAERKGVGRDSETSERRYSAVTAEMEENSRRLQEQKEMLSHFEAEIRGKQDHVIDLKRTIDSRQKLLAELRLIVGSQIDSIG